MVLGALKTQEEIAAKRCASMVGSTERVLIEEQQREKRFAQRSHRKQHHCGIPRRRRMDRRIQKCKSDRSAQLDFARRM